MPDLPPSIMECARAAYREAGGAEIANGHARNGQAVVPSPESNHFTDTGNARRVVERHGQDLRHVHAWKTWLVWSGQRWKKDDTGEVVRRVKNTCASLFKWASDKLRELADCGDADDEDRRRKAKGVVAVVAHCLKWEQAKPVRDCLDLMRSEPTVPVLPEHLDADHYLLNVLNGTLDLRTGRLHEHNRDDLITKLAPVEYDPAATCPLWERCLHRWMDGNSGLVDYLQRVVGCALTGDVGEQSLWFFHGAGANGKSTFLATILEMLGDYGIQAVSELLMARTNESHPTERADLFGKRFVATIETDQGKRMAEALMKQMTGGDKIRARRMRQDFFEFRPTHKLFLAANHRPTVRGTDYAVWRRIKLVPFTVTIPEEEKDKDLLAKLKAELPGILAWAVRGCLDWQRNGSLGEPDEVRLATAEYRAEQDVVAQFIADCCLTGPEFRVRASVVFDAYVRWSGDRSATQTAFGRALEAKGYAWRKSGGTIWRLGLALPHGESEEVGDS